MEWHYAVDGQSFGPVSEQEFASLVAQRTIQPETLVWQEGMDDWMPYGRMVSNASPSYSSYGADTTPSWEPKSTSSNPHASTFTGALTDALRRYADFSGRSSRSQYWYFILWSLIIGILTSIIDIALGINSDGIMPLNLLTSLFLFIPSLAVVIRRLHDSGRSGWWFLLSLIPIIGWIILIVFYCTRSEPRRNQWGDPPA